MAAKADFGRIFFPGNPWPKGHRIDECLWTARIERSTGVWADFHIRTEDYDAADRKSASQIDEDEPPELDANASRILWVNTGRMIFSTTFWPGQAFGVQMGSKEKPFDFRKLSGAQFRADAPPQHPGYPRPFVAYRWGDDAPAYHNITFKKETGKSTFAIHWLGRFGDFVEGKPDFPWPFEMKLKNVAFGGILFPKDTARDVIYALAAPYVVNAHRYKLRVRKDHVALMPF